MLNLLPTLRSVGLELCGDHIKLAEITIERGIVRIHQLHTEDSSTVKTRFVETPIFTTGLEARAILVRQFDLPITKIKDIDAALNFQAEPLLPYSIEEAILARQIFDPTKSGSRITLFASKKDLLVTHLETWKSLSIEPERVSCEQAALSEFGRTYIKSEHPYVIINLQELSMTGILVNKGRLIASYTLQEGTQSLFEQSTNKNEFFAEKTHSVESSSDALQKALFRITFALSKELKNEIIEGIVLTGDYEVVKNLDVLLSQLVQLPLLPIHNDNKEFADSELLKYAIPLGLAIGSLRNGEDLIDFRQKEFEYPHVWSRIKTPIFIYLAAIILLCVSAYLMGHEYLKYREQAAKQEYVDLLTTMNTSYNDFETSYQTKNGQKKKGAVIDLLPVTQLSVQDVSDRINFLQKNLLSAPDLFPLFPNIPKVSDVLAWLAHHPILSFVDENGLKSSRIQIENISYTLVKRPMQGKKQDRYQVKIELDFSSPSATWAREFHDALIAPNDWVDPKGEVKWNANRGSYKTSFFLKDKTIYHSL